MKASNGLALVLALSAGVAQAATQEVSINQVGVDGKEQAIGTVTISETDYGLLFTPELNSLDAGIHGFHVHQNPSCEPAEKDGKLTPAAAAGSHYDPENTGKHLGPYAEGHLGDLPALYVTTDGKAEYPVLAPRIKKLSEIEGRALMIHAGGDNHSDHPEALGGGGARVACGVIE
ncbi:MAG: superoxide dismutase [Cu-Zn] SodC [Halopseudomonas sp.]|uniref:superoxide dismutase [Cu-Zn] SodC n=1 Tax=Halopseudomonas sp. TaxID=2901191 RepID=UPI0030027C49